MWAIGRGPGNRGLAEAMRPIATTTVVALLLLLPGAALFFAVDHPTVVPGGGNSSRLSPFWDKPVQFIETGLAPTTIWNVNLSGTLGTSNTTTINFVWITGVFPFSVLPVAGYTANPSSGNVTVGSSGATVYITFTRLAANYTVTFTESGLPTGTPWWVNLNGTNISAATSAINFTVVNGTYLFTTPSLLAGTLGERFITSVTNGTVVVLGADVSVKVPYVTEFFLSMGVTPTGAGTVAPNSGWFAAGAKVNLSETPAAGYAFLRWNGSGIGNFSGIDASPTITMLGPIAENATFGLAYAVDFEEIGLLDGVTWSVTFNGVTLSALFVFLDFSASNGTYAYTVGIIPGFHADSYRGNVTVAGSDVTVIIHWVRVTYNVSFVESNLPSGTTWSVTLNGSPQSVMVSTILFLMSNGSFPFSVAPVTGFTANVTGGTVVVNGAAVVIAIGWTANGPAARSYTITFLETGLPANSSWSVTLNGSSLSSASNTSTTTSTNVVFRGLAAGTYAYWVPDVGIYRAATASGTATVVGENVTVTLPFSALGPAVVPAGPAQISVEDLIIFALIGGAAIVAAYLVYRRE